jgi:hypothetical protein
MGGIPSCAEFAVTEALTDPATIELWFKANPSESTSPLLSWQGLYSLSIDSDGFAAFSLGKSGLVMTGAPVTDGQLHHIAGIFADEKARLYLDGVQAGFDDGSLGSSAGTILRMGCDGTDSLNGVVEEVRVSSIERYTEDFEPDIAAFEKDKDTWALFHFDEGKGEESLDEVSSAPAILTEVEWVASPFGS